jgi:phospholipid transport system transporter-binding protein
VSRAKLVNDGAGSYRVEGVLDAASVPELLRESAARFAGAGAELYVDLGSVTESDSAGLALLIEWLRLARGRKQKLHFDNVPQQLRALARISEVEDLIDGRSS